MHMYRYEIGKSLMYMHVYTMSVFYLIIIRMQLLPITSFEDINLS